MNEPCCITLSFIDSQFGCLEIASTGSFDPGEIRRAWAGLSQASQSRWIARLMDQHAGTLEAREINPVCVEALFGQDLDRYLLTARARAAIGALQLQ